MYDHVVAETGGDDDIHVLTNFTGIGNMEVNAFQAHSDVVVQKSLREGFGLVVTVNLGIGQQTPPVASVLATACAIAKEDIWTVSRTNVYFIGVLVVVLLLVTYVPTIPLSLVRLFYG